MSDRCPLGYLFFEMFIEWSSSKYILFVQTSQFNLLSWPTKSLSLKNIKKSTPQELRVYMGVKLKFAEMFIALILFFLLLVHMHFCCYGNFAFP